MFIQGISLARDFGFVCRYDNGLGSDSLFATIFPGGVLPYIRCIGICRPKGYGFEPFCLKTGIDFENFGLKLGMVIRETFTKAYLNLFFLPNNQGE